MGGTPRTAPIVGQFSGSSGSRTEALETPNETMDQCENRSLVPVVPSGSTPDAPWQPQTFPPVDIDDERGLTFGSVEHAVRWAMTSSRDAKAFDPSAVMAGPSRREEAMVVRAYVLTAIDRVPVMPRMALVLYAHRESVEHVAKALKVRRTTAEAWLTKARDRMVAELGPRKLIDP